MRSPHIAYISTYAYAGGAANDVRSRGVLDALAKLGCSVEVMDVPAGFTSSRPRHGVGRVRRLLGVLAVGGGLTAWLDGLPERPDAVWLYGADIRFSARALRWARRRGVPVIGELVDWYELDDVSGVGPTAVLALSNGIAMPWLRRRAAGFVVASSELAGYVARHGTPAEVVPAVMSAVVVPGSRRVADGVLRVGYVGSPGRRDGPTLRNLEHVASAWEGPPLEIHVAGVDPPSNGWAARPEVRVVHHGRVPREEALALVGGCDATVLQRQPERRFARAGFPSKVAESMVLGTAPVVNPTSDLAALLHSGRDCILLRDDSAAALLDGLTALVESPIDRRQVEATGVRLFSVASAEGCLRALLSRVGVL